VTGIDRRHRLVLAHDHEEYPYDYLVVATGTKAIWMVPGAKTFWGLQGQEVVSDLLAASDVTALDRLVLTMPEPAVWPLPIYELALFIADRLNSFPTGPRVTVVTPESQPLQAFGQSASERVRALLEASAIELITGTAPFSFGEGHLETSAGSIAADRVLTLPRLEGRRIDGIPCNDNGFVSVDDFGLIEGCERECGAGDVVSHPLKFGGAATAQADVVAAAIGARAWGKPEPDGFRFDLQATLLTPRGPVPLVGEPSGEEWNPAQKVSGRLLTPLLIAERTE
jgi:sulfide:quinone oxidoreductase